MMRKKVLVEAYFAENLGDDLFLKVLFDRYPDIKWYLMTSKNKYKEIFKNYNNVTTINTLSVKVGRRHYNVFNKLHEKVLKYRTFDAFVNIGGSIFMENQAWEEKLEHRANLPRRLKRINRKTFIIGANFGPYQNDEFVKKHKSFFSNFDDICFRDTYSYNLFKELPNVRCAPDVVFNLETNKHEKTEKTIGFSIINIEKREGLKEYFDPYIEKMISIIEKYAGTGYKVKLFSFCEKEGDLDIIRTIMSTINPVYKDEVHIIKYEGNIDGFLTEFQSCEIIVGTRFHSVILALLFEQSVFPIIYSDKTYHVLADIGIEDNCCYIKDIESLDANELATRAARNKLKDNNIINRAENQLLELDRFLRSIQ